MMRDLRLISRAERIVASGRVVLAVTSLIAIYIDPSEPAKFQALTYALLVGYAAYAGIVVTATWKHAIQRRVWMIATHLFDLLVFTLFNYLTEGPTSPFFVFFVFSLFCATLRFESRGTLYTAAGAVSVFLIMGLYAGVVLEDPDFHINRFMIRSAYLLVVAALLYHLGRYQEEMKREIWQLAEWPRAMGPTESDVIFDSLKQASTLLRVPRVILVFSFGGDQRAIRGYWSDGGFTVAEERDEVDLFDLLEVSTSGIYLSRERGGPLWLPERQIPEGGDPSGLDDVFVSRLKSDTALIVKFREGSVAGVLLFLDRPTINEEDLALAEVVAGRVASRIEQFSKSQQLKSAAVSEERLRLARDLHDSLLQSLTGAALQLQTLHRVMERSPVEARKRIVEIQAIVEQDQRELRSYIDRLQQDPSPSPRLLSRLASLADRFRGHWDLEVALSVEPGLDSLSDGMKHEIYSVVNEAVANAAKHAQASNVKISASLDGEFVRITIQDDGQGFPFHGQYDLDAMMALRKGPVTLKERVASLGGNLVIDSSQAGARVDVCLPLKGDSTE